MKFISSFSSLLQAVTSSANADVFYWTSYVLWKSKPSDRTDNWAELALGYLLRVKIFYLHCYYNRIV